jgi:hypothetical protein
MSKLNDVLIEAEARLLKTVVQGEQIFQGKTVIVYNETDLIDKTRTVKAYPALGIVYEGMRSQTEEGATVKGLSAEIVLAFVLIEQGEGIQQSKAKKTRAIDYLDAMRDQFMGERSTVTGHIWHFMVEAPAELRSDMVCWVQRWSLPVQLPPKQKGLNGPYAP